MYVISDPALKNDLAHLQAHLHLQLQGAQCDFSTLFQAWLRIPLIFKFTAQEVIVFLCTELAQMPCSSRKYRGCERNIIHSRGELVCLVRHFIVVCVE